MGGPQTVIHLEYCAFYGLIVYHIFLFFIVIDDELFSISRFHPVFSKSNLKILTGQQYVINYEKGICMQAATSTC